MLHHYLVTAFRNLWRNRISSIINIAGLGTGIAVFGLILEYVSFERSVNQFHQNLPTLYRLMVQKPGGEVWTDMAPAVAPLAKGQFPEVREFCRIAEHSASGIVTLESGGPSAHTFREDKLAYADATFLTLFTFPLVQGTAATALSQPNTVAISQSHARKYFAGKKPLGRTLALNNRFGKTLYTVTAVYTDMPRNSDLQFDAVFSLQTLANPANLNGNGWARLDGFDGAYLTTFLQLPEKADHQALEAKINVFAKKLNPDDENRFLLQPALHMHLAASLDDPHPTSGNLGFVYLLSGIAVLILAIAWFNYINLSTANSLKRAKEVGVRKVAGARIGQLMAQFLGESLLLNAIGFGAGLCAIILLQDVFNAFVQKEFSLSALATGRAWVAGCALLLGGALASGGYVAFALTSFSPAQTLKGTFKANRNHLLRKTLVVAQFSVALVLIMATLTLYRQLEFMQNENLGVRIDQRVVLPQPQVVTDTLLAARTAVLENKLSQLPYVKRFCQTGIVPGGYYDFTAGGITKQNPRPDDAKQSYSMGIIDERYLATYGIGLAAGRNFTPREAELAWEKSARLMVNETAARQLGFASPAAAVGQTVNWGKPFEIVGVVEDYHHQGLRQTIAPVIFMPRRSAANLTVQLTAGGMKRKMAELERLYKASYPGNPFDFFFVDERYDQQYRTEQQYGQIFGIASALAICIACMGLFGLAVSSTESRTKEIGIRKVLGASAGQIVTLLSVDFLKLVLVAFVIATPVAWYAARQWLQNFAYRIDISWWIFALAGGLAVLVALLTVGFQAVKAALANPVKSLRSE